MMPATDDRRIDEVQIRVRDLHKSFGENRVLTGLDLDVVRGESLVVIGGSGSGKSVLLKHLIGLLRPDRGTVEVGGTRLDALSHRELTRFRRRFGMSFQEGALFDSMSVAENIGFPLRRQTDLGPDEIRRRVAECLALVHLEEEVGEKMPSELSGGMRRRVGFARAMAVKPEILLFDEPTTGLDPITTAVIDEVIQEINHATEATSVTITHDMTSAFRIADRIGMLHGGEVIALCPPEEFRTLDDPRVQQFLQGLTDEQMAQSSGRGGDGEPARSGRAHKADGADGVG